MDASQAEDAALRRVFAVTLSQEQATEGVAYLGGLAQVSQALLLLLRLPCLALVLQRRDSLCVGAEQELQAENGAHAAPVLLSKDNLERALMARLMEDAGDQWPVFYLVGCYARASNEFRAASALRSPAAAVAVQAALSLSKQLAVSYSGLLLTMDLFPQARCALLACP